MFIGNYETCVAAQNWRGFLDGIGYWVGRTLSTNEMDWLWNLGHGGLDYYLTPKR